MTARDELLRQLTASSIAEGLGSPRMPLKRGPLPAAPRIPAPISPTFDPNLGQDAGLDIILRSLRRITVELQQIRAALVEMMKEAGP